MNHFFSRKEQNVWQFVSLIKSLSNSKWSSAKPLWHQAWVEADFNGWSVTLKFGRINYLFNSCIYFPEMFVVVGLLCSLPSEIKRAASECSINTLQGAKSRAGCTSWGRESLFFPSPKMCLSAGTTAQPGTAFLQEFPGSCGCISAENSRICRALKADFPGVKLWQCECLKS